MLEIRSFIIEGYDDSNGNSAIFFLYIIVFKRAMDAGTGPTI